MRYSIPVIVGILSAGLFVLGPACSSSKKAEKQGGSMAKDKQMAGKKKAKKMKKMMKKMMKADKSKMPSNKNVRATVKQEEGKVTYWVTPGPRRLADHFGTEDNPKMTGMKRIKKAKGPMKKVLKAHPGLVGMPAKGRTVRDGTLMTKKPTPFSDKGIPVKNSSMEITYIDRTRSDKKGPPIKTADEIKADIEFQDPKGNSYKVMPKLAFQPPIPGYKTQGGVMTDDKHHGTTGTGSPLMPEVYTWGAFWSIADVQINGNVKAQNKNRVTHCMTTETVRDKDYRLPVDSELPLDKSNTIAGQMHHTHCIVLPIKFTPKGPKDVPVATEFELPNGKKQPFIHIMFEKDTLVDGPEWGGPSGM